MRRISYLSGLAIAMAASAPLPALAQQAEPIWLEIVSGDTPEIVAAKLQSLPSIRSVKVKRSSKQPNEAKIAIDYKAAGYPVLDEIFQIGVSFEGGGAQRVDLRTGESCATRLSERYSQIYDLLAAKYPVPIRGSHEPSDSDFNQAMVRATSRAPEVVSALVSNETTVAYFAAIITKSDPPPISYGSGKTLRALENLAWSEYQKRQYECSGDGEYRVSLAISYLPMAKFREVSDQIINDATRKRAEEGAKL